MPLTLSDDLEIVRTGEPILTTYLNALDMEGWVARLERMSGQRAGWGYVAGYATVYVLGDIDAALQAAQALRGDLDELYRRQARADGVRPVDPHRRAPWLTDVHEARRRAVQGLSASSP